MESFVARIAAAIAQELQLDAAEVAPLITAPNNPERGDLSLAGFALAGKLGRKGKDAALAVAQQVAGLDLGGISASADGAFVNFKVPPGALAEQVLRAVWAQAGYGGSQAGAGQTVVIDFSSPNIAKPFHLGHLRSTVIGWSLRQIFRALGYRVVGVNHLGDWGTQFGFMIAAWKRWGAEAMPRIEAGERDVDVFVELYVRINGLAKEDPSVRDEARSWFKKLEEGDPEARELWTFFVERSKAEFQRIYDVLGIEHESDAGEAFYNDKMPAVVEELRGSGLLVDGMTRRETALLAAERAEKKLESARKELESSAAELAKEGLKDKQRQKLEKRREKLAAELPELEAAATKARGAVPAEDDGKRPQGVDLSDEGMGFAILLKVDGGTTYTTRDITAAHYRADTYHPAKVLYVVGQDQRDHFVPWFKVIEKMGLPGAAGFEHVGFGKYLGMSTRKGTAVFLDEVLEKAGEKAREAASQATKKVELSAAEQEAVARAIGTGAVKFFDLKGDRLKDIDLSPPADEESIDWDRLLNLKGDSGPYLQFAHARLAGILEKHEGPLPGVDDVDFDRLAEPETQALIKAIAELPAKVQQAADQLEPSVIARYVLDLAAKTHAFLHHHRVLDTGDEALTRARLLLVRSAKKALAAALELLGIEALERM
ncbi:MAG: arginine--tRNA ligase [Planctomycetota bacterium]